MGTAVLVRSRIDPRRAYVRGADSQTRTRGSRSNVSKLSKEIVSYMSHQYRVAIAGATGAVGVEFLHCLEERNFPISELRLLASARSAGKSMPFRGREIIVEELTDNSFHDIDVAFFSAGGSISK